MVGARKNIYIIPVIVFGGTRKKMVDRFLFFWVGHLLARKKLGEKVREKHL